MQIVTKTGEIKLIQFNKVAEAVRKGLFYQFDKEKRTNEHTRETHQNK